LCGFPIQLTYVNTAVLTFINIISIKLNFPVNGSRDKAADGFEAGDAYPQSDYGDG
jgi:hypothetical protein